MPSLKFEGIDDYIATLEKLSGDAGQYIGRAVYVGAGVVADRVRESIQALPIENKHGSPSNLLTGVTRAQKQGLLDGFGISRMKVDGDFYNVKLGFNGYNSVKTKKYPKGQPNALIARSVNSGTSIRRKTGFVDKAVKAAKAEAEAAIAETLNKEIEERTN